MSDPGASTALVIHVQGSHYEMGLQHANQVRHLLPAIQRAIDLRFEQIARDQPDQAFRELVARASQVLDVSDRATLDMIRGLADGLGFPYEMLLEYNLVTFLRDVLVIRKLSGHSSPEGCSTWAATGAATADGQPILAKNRDFYAEHLPLQIIVRAEPDLGHRHTYVTSAGSPGVFVAGINDTGLALVDTHVSSLDIGAGLPTYALSMHILESHKTVRSAIEYLESMPRLGRNNLVLVDASGEMVVAELGHRRLAVRDAVDDMLVNTNHFACAKLQASFIDTNPPGLRGNSQQRFELLSHELARAHETIDIDFARRLMATHAGPVASICRHPSPDEETSTIATMLFQPAQRRLHFCHGSSCTGEYQILDYPQ